jgi:hypothetical protein
VFPIGIVYCGENATLDGSEVLLAFVTSRPVAGRPWLHEELLTDPPPAGLGPYMIRYPINH